MTPDSPTDTSGEQAFERLRERMAEYHARGKRITELEAKLKALQATARERGLGHLDGCPVPDFLIDPKQFAANRPECSPECGTDALMAELLN